jgi:hypothetical protein
MRARNLFGLLAAVSAVGASMAVTGLSDGPIRALATLSFLLVGPGLALVPLLRLDGVLAPAVAVVAASVVLDGVIAETLVLARAWSPTLGLGILVTITLLGAALQIVVASRRESRARRRAVEVPS